MKTNTQRTVGVKKVVKESWKLRDLKNCGLGREGEVSVDSTFQTTVYEERTERFCAFENENL